MKSQKVPFENRWTNGTRAWEWNCELERLGLTNVRAMFVDHETRHPCRRDVIFDIPPGFVRDWLAFHDRRIAHQQFFWRITVIVLNLVAVAGVLLGFLRL
jgi:hypothetical protein